MLDEKKDAQIISPPIFDIESNVESAIGAVRFIAKGKYLYNSKMPSIFGCSLLCDAITNMIKGLFVNNEKIKILLYKNKPIQNEPIILIYLSNIATIGNTEEETVGDVVANVSFGMSTNYFYHNFTLFNLNPHKKSEFVNYEKYTFTEEFNDERFNVTNDSYYLITLNEDAIKTNFLNAIFKFSCSDDKINSYTDK